MAKLLLERSVLARETFEIVHGRVRLLDPLGYNLNVSAMTTAALDEELQNIGDSVSRAPRRAQLHRYAKQWRLNGRQLILSGVNIDGKIVRDPLLKADALGAAWTKTFSANPAVDSCKAKEFLERYATKYDLTHMHIPDVNDIPIFLKHAKNTAPGPDGIPYAGWLAAGHAGAVTLHNVLVHMHCGFAMPFDFYASLGEFPPKGDCDADSVEIIRTPPKTRPLNLKNCDNKAITGTVISGYREPMKSSTHESQRGFVPDRYLTQNVLDLDSAGRILAFPNQSNETLSRYPAILTLFDFMAAFPSVFHGWIFLVLEARQFPVGFIDFIKSLYAFNFAIFRQGGVERFLFWIWSGVLQGCPASSFLSM